jgi:hypothetical protein
LLGRRDPSRRDIFSAGEQAEVSAPSGFGKGKSAARIMGFINKKVSLP